MREDFITYPELIETLTKKFGKPPSEIEFYMWCWEGKEHGGIDLYPNSALNCDEPEQIENMRVDSESFVSGGTEDLGSQIRQMQLFWFKRSDIEGFKPARHFMSADELKTRWALRLGGENEAEERIKLYAVAYPDWGVTDDTPKLRNYFYGSIVNDFDPLQGIYTIQDISAVEIRYFPRKKVSGIPVDKSRDSAFFEVMPEYWEIKGESERQLPCGMKEALEAAVNVAGETGQEENQTLDLRGNREKQIGFIINTVTSLGYSLHEIPEGGKKSVKTECLKNLTMTQSAFKKAWSQASINGLLSIKDREKFLVKQN